MLAKNSRADRHHQARAHAVFRYTMSNIESLIERIWECVPIVQGLGETNKFVIPQISRSEIMRDP
jgi:hypothetical protein